MVVASIRRRRVAGGGGRCEYGPAAKHSLASFRLRMKLRFINACLHPCTLRARHPVSHARRHPPPGGDSHCADSIESTVSEGTLSGKMRIAGVMWAFRICVRMRASNWGE